MTIGHAPAPATTEPDDLARACPGTLIEVAATLAIAGRVEQCRATLTRAVALAAITGSSPDVRREVAAGELAVRIALGEDDLAGDASRLLAEPALSRAARTRLRTALVTTAEPQRAPAGRQAPALPDEGELRDPSTVSVAVLGPLRVRRGDRPVSVIGRPAELLCYLALHGEQARTETVIDTLWPDTDLPTGRRRLRTVMARLRRSAGDVVRRDGGVVELQGVTTDVVAFTRLARVADTCTDLDQAAEAARAALEHFRGEPVPEIDRDWAVWGRRSLLERALALHDRLARATEQRGRLEESITALEDAVTLDPGTERRYLTIARLSAELERPNLALSALERARHALHDVGLPVSDELPRLEAYLRRRPSLATSRR